jgi:hypothetical protein
MNRERYSRGHFCGTVRATQATNTLVGRGGRRGSTSTSEQKPLVEEVASNLEENSTAYVDLNPPKIPSHKCEPSISSTLEESVAFGGPVKFWKNPLYFMAEGQGEEGEGSVPQNPVTFEFPIRDIEGTT